MSKLLGERYLLGAMIGTGGMADVYIAQDQRLSRELSPSMTPAKILHHIS